MTSSEHHLYYANITLSLTVHEDFMNLMSIRELSNLLEGNVCAVKGS